MTILNLSSTSIGDDPSWTSIRWWSLINVDQASHSYAHHKLKHSLLMKDLVLILKHKLKVVEARVSKAKEEVVAPQA